MEIKLDENDLKILDILSREPRASISKISKETGLSRPTVHSRI
ncbi:MAG: winged helix-turn-helix transcriptional regulator [Infirmifilum sp.]